MPEKLPTSMFCGLPVSVATLPTFAAVARAIRYGTGGRWSRRVTASTRGASTRQTTSFTKKAESTPAAPVTAPSRASGVRALRIVHAMTRPKNPERRRYAVTIIMPKSSTRVCASTEATASSPAERARDDHRRGADDRDARAVHAEAGDPAEAEPRVGADE